MSRTINRDAGDKSKGFRLQRLRAIKLLLEQMQQDYKNVRVYASTEYMDDVYIKKVLPSGVISYTEGDKNYNPTKRFSFMSKEVTNSLIIYLDNWLNCSMSDSLYYCFYTNVEYTTEKNTKTLRGLGIDLPEKSILNHLINQEYDVVIDCVKKKLLFEYEEQYKNAPESGYLEVIKNFRDSQWITFLSRIDWKFGQYNEIELQQEIIQIIKSRNFLKSVDVSEKEDLLIDIIENQFSQNEQITDEVTKHVTTDQVQVLFYRLSTSALNEDDPVYEIWNGLEKPTDNRGLKDKILDVEAGYKARKLGLKARNIVTVKDEYNILTEQQKGSYRYRIFEACLEKLNELLDEEGAVDVDHWLEELFKAAKQHLKDKSKDYSYPLKSDGAIKGAILELIDSCFLSFDEKGFYNGDI